MESKTGMEKRKRTQVKVWLAIAAFLALVWTAPVVYAHYSELEIRWEDEYMEVEGHHGEKIYYADMKEISLQPKLPRTIMRSNGFACCTTRLGEYLREDKKTITLFTHSDSCCIKIECTDGSIFYLNAKTVGKTMEVYDRLRKGR